MERGFARNHGRLAGWAVFRRISARLTRINVEAHRSREAGAVNQTELTMTTGNLLYLLMAIGVFIGFAAVLAYVSWQQSQTGPDMIGTRVADEQGVGQGHHPVHA
jgi:hypothetical protein